jgi:hypothetical protein
MQIPGSKDNVEAYVGTIVNVPLNIVLKGLPPEWKYAGWGDNSSYSGANY